MTISMKHNPDAESRQSGSEGVHSDWVNARSVQRTSHFLTRDQHYWCTIGSVTIISGACISFRYFHPRLNFREARQSLKQARSVLYPTNTHISAPGVGQVKPSNVYRYLNVSSSLKLSLVALAAPLCPAPCSRWARSTRIAWGRTLALLGTGPPGPESILEWPPCSPRSQFRGAQRPCGANVTALGWTPKDAHERRAYSG